MVCVQTGRPGAGRAKRREGSVLDTDDLEPVARPAGKPDMDLMSIDELNDYIAGLQAEIDRARAAIAAKQDYKSGAEAFFKN